MDEEWLVTWARKHANNLQACSCHMCCNPRRTGQKTKQEMIAELREDEAYTLIMRDLKDV